MSYKRRDFLRHVGLGALGGATWPIIERSTASKLPVHKNFPEDDVSPTPAQRAWMDLGFGLFVHFGIKTVYPGKSSDGDLDPARFNPTGLDTDEWCRVAKEAGMKYVVLVTKHHDGFCLWPSEYTDYSVENTPYGGDVVAELVESAEKHGLSVGFYYSLSDEHEDTFPEESGAYLTFMKNQLEELLSQYGDVVELWLDGFWERQQHGWTEKPEEDIPREQWIERAHDFINAWRMEGAYRWQIDHVYQFVKSLQPDCMVMNNATTAYQGVPLHPVDVRPGERYTDVLWDKKQWSWLGDDIYLPMQIEVPLSDEHWFWKDDDTTAVSVETVRNYLREARRVEANLLLNVGPNPQGQLRDIDRERLSAL